MKVYMILGFFTVYDGDRDYEWMFIVADKEPEFKEAVAMFKKHVHETTVTDYEDFDIIEEEVFINEVSVDGYKIQVTEGDSHD